MLFYLAQVRILGSMEYGNTRNDCFCPNTSKSIYKVKNIMQKNPAKKPVCKYRVNIGVEM